MTARWLMLVLAVVSRAAWAAELRVYFLDVGQGDSELILSPTGKSVLLDAGPPAAARALAARIRELIASPLDLVLLTHAHLDHVGGMEAAIEARGARLFMDPAYVHPSPAYEKLLRALQQEGIPLKDARAGRRIDIGGGASIEVLWPGHNLLSGTRSDANANSVVTLLSYGAERFLFAGDAEAETEAALLQDPSRLRAAVLKVAHHGSQHSSGAAFLSAVHPEVAVISCGLHNAYGHPGRDTLLRLAAVGVRVLRTDVDGEVEIDTDGKTLQVRTRSPSHQPPEVEHGSVR